MLPSKNRIKTKKILQPTATRSVALSSEPILLNDNKPNANGRPIQQRQQPTNAASNASSKAVTKTTNKYSSEQYTYVTDDNGYTWLYDTANGAYFYYDPALGTYIPYQHAPEISEPTKQLATETETTEKEDKPVAKHPNKKRRTVRMAGGQVWEDTTLDDWPTDDYRLFAGDLGPEVTSEILEQTFQKFPSLQRTHVVSDKKSGKSRGYGFLSFGDADDFLAAWKEFNGKYVGSRPIKLRKSTWKSRNVDIRKAKRVDKRAVLDYKKHK